MFIGGVSAFFGYKVGKYISSKLLNINTNLGMKDFLNMAKVDGANSMMSSIIAFKSKIYTMGATFLTAISRGVVKTIGNWINKWLI